MQNKNWAQLLAYVMGLVNPELVLQNEYLAAEKKYFTYLLEGVPDSVKRSAADESRRAGGGKSVELRTVVQETLDGKPTGRIRRPRWLKLPRRAIRRLLLAQLGLCRGAHPPDAP